MGRSRSEAQNSRTDNKVDLTGKQFGRLTVLRHIRPGSRIEVKCACGVIKIVNKLSNIYRIQSCGCQAVEQLKLRRTKPAGIVQTSRHLHNYKMQANYRKLEWGLTDEEARYLFTQVCHYCGSAPEYRKTGNAATGANLSGIDRMDNSIGYVKINCVPCCTLCNILKKAMSYSDFLQRIEKIYRHSLKNILWSISH